MEKQRRTRSHAERRRGNAVMGRRRMTADEQQAFDAAVKIIERLPSFVCERRLALEAMEVLAASKQRAYARHCSDRQTDRKRRKLIGAKLPIEVAEEIELLAELQGISVYRFVVDALEAARKKVKAKYGHGDVVEVQQPRRRPCVAMALPCRQNCYSIE